MCIEGNKFNSYKVAKSGIDLINFESVKDLGFVLRGYLAISLKTKRYSRSVIFKFQVIWNLSIVALLCTSFARKIVQKKTLFAKFFAAQD